MNKSDTQAALDGNKRQNMSRGGPGGAARMNLSFAPPTMHDKSTLLQKSMNNKYSNSNNPAEYLPEIAG